MFGYVRVDSDRLSPDELKSYEAAYCGVCRGMGERYGQFPRFFLNYDFALLAMLLAPSDAVSVTGCRRCPAHPVKGKACCEKGLWLEVAAGESVILTWWKLKDSIRDNGFFAGVPARLLNLCLTPGYRKAKRDYPIFDAQVAQQLEELGALESEGCTSIDRTAHCFASLLAATAPATGAPERDRAMGQMLYHVGRWIYLIDAVDDLEEDRRRRNYNPVLARFPQWSEEDKQYLRKMMDHSLSLAGAAFQLLESNAWHSVMENILYRGLPGVEELVFTGQWREYLKRQRRVSR